MACILFLSDNIGPGEEKKLFFFNLGSRLFHNYCAILHNPK